MLMSFLLLKSNGVMGFYSGSKWSAVKAMDATTEESPKDTQEDPQPERFADETLPPLLTVQPVIYLLTAVFNDRSFPDTLSREIALSNPPPEMA